MSLYISKDSASLAEAVAKKILETGSQAVRERGAFSLAVSGGKTPESLFKVLAMPYFKTRFPVDQSTLLWVDERAVPPQDSMSNYGVAKRLWLDPVGFPASRVLRMPGEMAPPQSAARAYENALKSHFHLDLSFPKIDLVLLGLGEDGHTASLFPNTEALLEEEKWVMSVHVPAAPSERLTMTLPLLNNAVNVVFMASGEKKAGVVRDLLRKEIPAPTFPASMIKPASGLLEIFVDATAATKLLPDQKNAAHYL